MLYAAKGARPRAHPYNHPNDETEGGEVGEVKHFQNYLKCRCPDDAAAKAFRGEHLSHTTCLTPAFFKRGE